jgi:hypothetical protein
MEYKLIKKYPSLPQDWEEGMIVGLGDRCTPTSFSPCNGKYKDYYVPYEEVTKNSEYWELQSKYITGTKVKDTYSTGGYIYTKLNNGRWKMGNIDTFQISENSIGEGKRFEVTNPTREEIMDECIKEFPRGSKVKSAYGEEIFTIAQEYTTPGTHDWKEGVYYFGCDGDVLAMEEGKSRGNYLYYEGQYATLIEKPVLLSLISEDEVILFENDVCYLVHLPLTSKSSLKYAETTLLRKELLPNPSYRLIFASKEAAEDYLLMNKPSLSIKDIQSIYISARGGYKKNGNGIDYLEELKKLVLSK